MRLLFFSLMTLRLASVAAGADALSPKETEAARKLYTAKCAKCHKFYDPAKYAETEWRDWMTKMSKKAKLKADQKELLSRYLDTFKNGNRTNTSSRVR